MKRIMLSLLLVLSAVASYSQGIIIGSSQPRRIIWDQSGRIQDSILVLPVRDTIAWTDATFRSLGRITIRPQDSLPYYHRGNKWILLLNSSVSVDTTSLSNRITLRVKYTDTSQMLANYLLEGVAATTYQPIGTYLVPGDTLNKWLPIGYSPPATVDSTTAGLWLLESANQLRVDTASAAAYLLRRADSSIWLTPSDAAASYQPLGSYVPSARTLTINGVSFDLSANRTWTITGIDSTNAGYGLSETSNTLNVDTTLIQKKVSAGAGINVSGNVITNTGIITEVDGSITNELQTLQQVTTLGATSNVATEFTSSLRATQMLLNNGSTRNIILAVPNDNTNYTATFQAASGTIAYLTNIPGTPTFDDVLGSGNIATNKQAVHNFTAVGDFWVGQRSGSRSAVIGNGGGSGAGYFRAINPSTGDSTTYRATNIMNNTALLTLPIITGTLALLTDIPTALPNPNALTINSPLTGTSYDGSAPISIGIPQSSGSVSGYLGSTDWTTFNNKLSAGAYTGTNLSLTSGRLLGRTTALTGLAEEITPNSTLTFGSLVLGINLNNANTWTATQTFPRVSFSTVTPSFSAYSIVADTAKHALTYYNDISGSSQQIGFEDWIYVRNVSGSSIANGTPVYMVTSAAGVPNIAPAQANAAGTSEVIGLTTSTIANNSFGLVTNNGVVNDLNTNAFTAGTVLYLSAASPGVLTSTVPAAPNFRVQIGRVNEQNATTGSILMFLSRPALGLGTPNQVYSMNAAGTANEYHSAGGAQVDGANKSGVINALSAATTALFTTNLNNGDFVPVTAVITTTSLTGTLTGTLTATITVGANILYTVSMPAANANTVGEHSTYTVNLGSLNVPANTAISIVIATPYTVATVASLRVDVLGYYTN